MTVDEASDLKSVLGSSLQGQTTIFTYPLHTGQKKKKQLQIWDKPGLEPLSSVEIVTTYYQKTNGNLGISHHLVVHQWK
jgi:hypothetical protein